MSADTKLLIPALLMVEYGERPKIHDLNTLLWPMTGILSQIAHDGFHKVFHIILRRDFHIMSYNTGLIVWICACACQNFKAMMNVVP